MGTTITLNFELGSGVPKGSVLGPYIYIYRRILNVNIDGLVSAFPGDTKIGGLADKEEGCQWFTVGYRYGEEMPVRV